MQKAEKIALVETSLLRASEAIGDLTEPVMARFYRQYPQVRAAFEHHAGGDRGHLEAMMIENVLYCIMYWFERPDEIQFLLFNSVPHHAQTLKVDADWYEALMAAGIDLIANTVPAEAEQELAVWEEMRCGFSGAFSIARRGICSTKNAVHEGQDV